MIEKEIREIINEATNSKYVGKLRVTKELMMDEDLWSLFLYLDTEQSPLILAYQGTVDEFKNFIRKEMKARKLQMIKYWNTIRELPDYNQDDHWNE